MQQAKIRNKKRIQQHSFRAGFHTPRFQDDHLKVSQGPGSWRDLILAHQGKTDYFRAGFYCHLTPGLNKMAETALEAFQLWLRAVYTYSLWSVGLRGEESPGGFIFCPEPGSGLQGRLQLPPGQNKLLGHAAHFSVCCERSTWTEDILLQPA